MIFAAIKNARTKKEFSPPFLLMLLLDPGSGINFPDQQHSNKASHTLLHNLGMAIANFFNWCYISSPTMGFMQLHVCISRKIWLYRTKNDRCPCLGIIL
jgi:hypothetical protein